MFITFEVRVGRSKPVEKQTEKPGEGILRQLGAVRSDAVFDAGEPGESLMYSHRRTKKGLKITYPAKSFLPWALSELKLCREMAQAGKSDKEIGKTLNRTPHTVKAKIAEFHMREVHRGRPRKLIAG